MKLWLHKGTKMMVRWELDIFFLNQLITNFNATTSLKAHKKTINEWALHRRVGGVDVVFIGE